MRVISGSRRGLKLNAPKGLDTRPTSDKVKESVFNILGQNFPGAEVLDIFCGSGANGIEFLSRGAEVAYFLDNSDDAIKILKENLKKAKFSDYAVLLKGNIGKLKTLDIKFDYIYLDPPFDREDLYRKSLKIIYDFNLLKEDGSVVVEYATDIGIPDFYGFKKIKTRKYGNTSISIWGWDR
ncbi:16S rRNA (guanine(966)-N(2))-methyltransferase RsmD [Peptoniphilus olsenii]|uniref:16S rRNA (Guanine(966)-N(2))-methyltransferase RsmD n=1 Tax=Peptoniphilus olsenii TaxID=411570 RepID=A0ABV2J9C9_9FIRM